METESVLELVVEMASPLEVRSVKHLDSSLARLLVQYLDFLTDSMWAPVLATASDFEWDSVWDPLMAAPKDWQLVPG